MRRVNTNGLPRVTITFDPTTELLADLDEFVAMINQYWTRDEREKAGYSRWGTINRTSVLRVALRNLLCAPSTRKVGKKPAARSRTTKTTPTALSIPRNH